MFRTFREEEERPNYGITTPLKSWNPVYANFAHYIDLFGILKETKSFGDGMRVLFKKPGWKPAYLGGYETPASPPEDYAKYDQLESKNFNAYIFSQFLILLTVVPPFFFIAKDMDLSLRLIYAAWVVWTTISFGLIFELEAKYYKFFEILRLVCLPLIAFMLMVQGIVPAFVFYVICGAALLSVAFFFYSDS